MNGRALAVAAVVYGVLALPLVVVVTWAAVCLAGVAGLAVPVLAVAGTAYAVRSFLPRGGAR